RPDHDLPMGFIGTYRFELVRSGEIPAGPTDREALDRLPDRAAPADGFPVPPVMIGPSLSVDSSSETAPPGDSRADAKPSEKDADEPAWDEAADPQTPESPPSVAAEEPIGPLALLK
ncbi:MAG: hypothetical protein AAF907_10555, partial [Planctomycetota bacterium]